MKKSLHLLLIALTLYPFHPSWGGLEVKVSPEKIRKLTPCALELLLKSTGASFQAGGFIQEWFVSHSTAGLSEAEDRLMQLLFQSRDTEALHIKGRQDVSRFLYNWAELIDEQVASPTRPAAAAPSKTKEVAKTAFNLLGAMVFLTVIYSHELVHPNTWSESRFGLMLNMWMSHWCWLDVWRGIKNTKLRTALTVGSSMLGMTLPALLIPEMQSGHEATIQILKEMSLMIGASHLVTVSLFQKAIKPKAITTTVEAPAEPPKPPAIAVRSRPRDLQVEVQGSHDGHYFYVQFEVPADGLTKPRFLDVILYQGDSALNREPELLVVRSNHRPEQIYDELVRYESERQTGN